MPAADGEKAESSAQSEWSANLGMTSARRVGLSLFSKSVVGSPSKADHALALKSNIWGSPSKKNKSSVGAPAKSPKQHMVKSKIAEHPSKAKAQSRSKVKVPRWCYLRKTHTQDYT